LRRSSCSPMWSHTSRTPQPCKGRIVNPPPHTRSLVDAPYHLLLVHPPTPPRRFVQHCVHAVCAHQRGHRGLFAQEPPAPARPSFGGGGLRVRKRGESGIRTAAPPPHARAWNSYQG
jgi:hypothetical protein